MKALLLVVTFRQVIITTHAMEEAEALCSRIGIMIQVSASNMP